MRWVHILPVLMVATLVSGQQNPPQSPSPNTSQTQKNPAPTQTNPQTQANSETEKNKKADDQSGKDPKSTAKTQQTTHTSTAKPVRPQAPSYVYKVVSLGVPQTSAVLDASQIVSAMGNPAPFTLKAAGTNAIVISSTKRQLNKADLAVLDDVIQHIQELRAIQQTGPVKSVHPTKLELYIPHTSSLGDVVKSVSSLNYKSISVEAVGRDKIRVTPGADVNDQDFASFLNDLNHLAWQAKTQSPVARVFYITTTDARAAMGGGPQPDQKTNGNGPTDAGTPKSQDGGTPNTKDNSDTQKSGTSGSDSTSQTKAKKNPGKGPTGKSKNSGQQEKSKSTDTNKSKGKDTSQKSPASDTSATGQGSSDSDTSGAGKDNSAEVTQTSQSQDAGQSPGGKQAKDQGTGADGGGNAKLDVKSVNNDVVVMSGDESLMGEAKRVLAAVDFPRPEVIINAWSFQASSSNPQTIMKQSDRLRNDIGEFNDAIQRGIDRAWRSLQDAIGSHPEDFFDEDFYNYLTQHYVADSRFDQASTQRLIEGPAYLRHRQRYGICEAHQYCLGYTSLFRPLRPTLTDMLLAVIASEKPGLRIRETLRNMDNLGGDDQRELPSDQRCDVADLHYVVFRPPNSQDVLPMFCFWQEVNSEFPDGDLPRRFRVLRGALANFLFHYKMAEQYPHEFSPYDLSQSAQQLNSALNPLIVAFNRDIAALLSFISDTETLAPRNGIFGFGGHGTSFINNGIITVRTLSGKETKVDTVTQSVFDATNPPSVTDIISSIGSAESNVPGPLKTNLSANQAAVIIGALSSVAPSESKVGREFDIDITPHSLSGASSAELDISMTTQESAEPTLFTNGKSNTENLSRVGKHNIQTKVRLESIKLFEISSFSAFLERSRRNFPLVPPFIELPYLGSFISLPLPGAKEYHRSTAIMSAIVVPTAGDLANGLRFTADRIAVAATDPYGSSTICSSSPYGTQDVLCTMRTAVSLGDLGYSINAYHKAKLICLSTQSSSPFGPFGMQCSHLDMTKLPQDAP